MFSRFWGVFTVSETSLTINATGSQRGLSSQPRFIEVANPREHPYSGIKRPAAQQSKLVNELGPLQQDIQPLSWRAQSKGFRSPYGA